MSIQYAQLLERQEPDESGTGERLKILCQDCAALEGRQEKLAYTVAAILLKIRERDALRLCTKHFRARLASKQAELEKVERELRAIRDELQPLSLDYIRELDEEDSDG